MTTDSRAFWFRGLCLGLALGVHVLLIGGSLWWRPAQEASTETAMTLVMVEMVDMSIAPAPPAPPEPPAVPPSKPPPQTPASPAPLPLPEPSFEVSLEPVVPEREEAPAPEHPPEADETAQVPTDPALTPPPTNQHNASAQAVMSWQQQLLAHLQRYRRYPAQAKRLRQEGVAHVRFSVNRQGRISHPRIEHPSGHRLLDEETLATVHRANPVPPPPVDMPGNPVDVVVPVGFHLRKR